MKLDIEMAEFIGIFIGDGSLNVRKEKYSYEFKFTGNIKDEIPYFEQHVAKLASKILNRNIKTKILDGGGTVGLYFCSKELANYFQGLGVPPSPKYKIAIPKRIFKSHKLMLVCLRGLFDTDGCFTLKKGKSYPVVTFTNKSKPLIKQIKYALNKLRIPHTVCLNSYLDKRTNKVYSRYYLDINGKNNTAQFFKLINSNNPKTRNKYELYKKNMISGG